MFKRSIVTLTTLAAIFCPSVDAAAPVASHEQAVEFNYTAREVGNGNGNGNFHERVWPVFKPTPRPIKPDNTDTVIKPPDTRTTIKPPDTRTTIKSPDTDTVVKPPIGTVTTIRTPTDNSTTYNADDTWLIYYYVCGTDLEELHRVATGNFHEIQGVQLPPNVKILIKTGGATKWHHENVDDGGLWLYSSNSRDIQWLKSLNEDMGNPATLTSFLKFGEENYKADHKVLIFQNHGGFNGICYDHAYDGNPATENHLSFNDLHESFAEFYEYLPQAAPFELVAFDTCMSGSYECAKSLEGFTRYMMAYETSTFSWDYTPWLKRFVSNTAINGGTLGKFIAEESQKAYGTRFYEDKSTGLRDYCINVVNFAVIDMTKLPALTSAYDDFFGAAIRRGYSEGSFYANFARIAQDPNNLTGAEHYENLYIDLGRLAEKTQTLLPEARTLLARVQEAVWSLPGHQRNGLGLSTYYPYNRGYLDELPANNQKTFYYNLLNRVRTGDASQPIPNIGAQQSQVADPYNIAALQGAPLTLGADNHVTAKLNASQLESISQVRCAIMALVDPENKELKAALGLEDYAIAFLGNDADVKVDWKTGTFKDNFRGVFPMLDGHAITLVTDFASNDFVYYTCPIMHNDDEKFLKVVYSYASKNYVILGVCDDVDEHGVALSEIVPLEEGDEIAPMFMALVDTTSKDKDYNEVFREVECTWMDGRKFKGAILLTEGESFEIGKAPKIEDRVLPNAPYGYAFQFFAPDGGNSASQIAFFDVEYGKIVNSTLMPYDAPDKVNISAPEE